MQNDFVCDAKHEQCKTNLIAMQNKFDRNAKTNLIAMQKQSYRNPEFCTVLWAAICRIFNRVGQCILDFFRKYLRWFVMFCCFCGHGMETSFFFCPNCGKKKSNGTSEPSSSSVKSPCVTHSTGNSPTSSNTSSSCTSLSTFMKNKEAERRSHFEPKRKKSRSATSRKNTEVFITVVLMEYDHDDSYTPRRVFGKTFPVKVTPDMVYDQVLKRSLTKWANYDRTFCPDRGYVLVYPDGQLARTIPGGDEEFVMGKYKEELGKAYSRISL